MPNKILTKVHDEIGLLCALPAIRSLRKANPYSEILVSSKHDLDDLVSRFPLYLDGIVTDPIERDYDLIVDFAEETVPKITRQPHLEIQNCIQVIEDNGIDCIDDSLELKATAKEQEEFAELGITNLCEVLDKKGYVVINPSNTLKESPYSLIKYAQIADEIAERGYLIVFIGNKHNLTTNEIVMSRMRHNAINLTGNLSFGATLQLINKAELIVSGNYLYSFIAGIYETQTLFIINDTRTQDYQLLNENLQSTYSVIELGSMHFDSILEEKLHPDNQVHKIVDVIKNRFQTLLSN
jgi:hypothetical protein